MAAMTSRENALYIRVGLIQKLMADIFNQTDKPQYVKKEHVKIIHAAKIQNNQPNAHNTVDIIFKILNKRDKYVALHTPQHPCSPPY